MKHMPLTKGGSGRMWRDVMESLRSQPGRVGLSFLSVMVGIVVLTLLLAMLMGLGEQSRQLIHRFGANVAALVPDSRLVADRGYRGVSVLTDLVQRHSGTQPSAAMIRMSDTVAPWNNTPVWAAGIAIASIRGWTIDEGRLFDHTDDEQAARVALVTRETAKLYGVRAGDECIVGRHAFKVVGILRDGSGIPDASRPVAGTGEAMVLIPLSAAERLELPFEDESAAIFTRPSGDESLETLVARLDRMLADPTLAAWNMKWITPETLIRGIRDLQRLIALTAGSVAALCLLLGGTTLMSLMLADVRQRIPEIGLRRAIGATRGDVALLFVVESCVITGAAAVGGVAIAALLLVTLTGRVAIPLSLQSFTFVIPVIVSIVLGCIFSFWPARAAAGLSPAQALRNA